MTIATKYFILTTSAVTESHFDGAVECSGGERTNNDGLKTVLEVCNFNPNDTEGAFYGETPYTHDEILVELLNEEWQGE